MTIKNSLSSQLKLFYGHQLQERQSGRERLGLCNECGHSLSGRSIYRELHCLFRPCAAALLWRLRDSSICSILKPYAWRDCQFILESSLQDVCFDGVTGIYFFFLPKGCKWLKMLQNSSIQRNLLKIILLIQLTAENRWNEVADWRRYCYGSNFYHRIKIKLTGRRNLKLVRFRWCSL